MPNGDTYDPQAGTKTVYNVSMRQSLACEASKVSKKPILLQAGRKSVPGYQQKYFELEDAAIKKAGFEVFELNAGIFGIDSAPDYDLTGRPVFCRHYSDEDKYFIPYIEAHGGFLTVPNYPIVQDWYKILPLDFIAREWMGARKMAWYPLKPYGFLEEQAEIIALRMLIDEVFDEFAIDGKVFAKSETKNSFTASLYTKKELFESLMFLIGVGCHRTPRELIVSQPMPIKHLNTDYKRDEYRCLVVDGRVSTISLYTDQKKDRYYGDVRQFATQFAHTFALQLPSSYDLDVARLANGDFAVVELNDIAACGLYADHDVQKFFSDVYQLAIKTLQKH